MLLDRLGILGSAACAFHCALPMFLSFFSPSLSSFFENERVHYILLITVIPLALFSFLKSRGVHKKNSPLFLGSLGVIFLITAVFVKQPFGLSINSFELLATVVGSLILILSHFLNLHLIGKRNSLAS